MKTCSVDERNPPKKKRNNDSVKGHVRKDPRKANRMKYVLFHCFSVQVRARRGGWGEEETQAEKEEE